MKIFSGSSNPQLAKKVADKLKTPLGKIELLRFANGECRVWVREKVAGDKAIIIQSLSFPPDEHLIELCLMVDALKRLGSKRIIALVPWLGYCIQDKVFRPGEPLSAKVIAKIIQSFKINHLITLDLHNETIAGFFDLPFTNLSALFTFVDFFVQKKVKFDLIVSPDVGGLKRATKFAQSLNLPLAVVNKKRDLTSGKVSILGINTDVRGKRVLIVDDFISTGATLIKEAQFLKERGASKVFAAVTHHFYIEGVQEKIEKSQLDKLFVTDSIAIRTKIDSKKLKVISISNLLAQALRNC